MSTGAYSDAAYSDLNRPPLHQAALRRALVVPGGFWTDLRIVDETGSTNADVAAAARDGAPEGLVIVAERQNAGRGRLGRQWQSPARAGLSLSLLLRPQVPPTRLGWLPLLAGVALAEAVRRVARVDAYLKWPNDLLLPGARSGSPTQSQRAGLGVDLKTAGILAEAAGDGAVVIGIGLNVTLREDELPRPDATSLALGGAAGTDRDPLLRALLRATADWYARFTEHGGDPEASGLREAYVFHCGTVGRRVRVELPGGEELEGLATGVDGDGRLQVADRLGAVHAVAAGDVVHARLDPLQ
ncbi:biotin--[acetyl-CoA-carboxylase] ligase [Dactylosporangium sp. NPDC000555]|uniref:biotin--[acetyl-CoA-carboxylase] ligase n=1 Tax=Dactylosporangium sp. NPDC000555 TaxID=3154260 RepID=UPI00331ED547